MIKGLTHFKDVQASPIPQHIVEVEDTPAPGSLIFIVLERTASPNQISHLIEQSSSPRKLEGLTQALKSAARRLLTSTSLLASLPSGASPYQIFQAEELELPVPAPSSAIIPSYAIAAED